MFISRRTLVASSLFVLGLTANIAPASAGQWYFYVQNSTGSTMKGLYAAEPGGSWGQFDIGSGIEAGQTVKMNWSSSTDDQSCKQYLKATFSDGSEIKSSKIDFCHDLDSPVVFSN